MAELKLARRLLALAFRFSPLAMVSTGWLSAVVRLTDICKGAQANPEGSNVIACYIQQCRAGEAFQSYPLILAG